jgi:hypothetical protein
MPSDNDSRHRAGRLLRTVLVPGTFIACLVILTRCRTSVKSADHTTDTLAGVDRILEEQRLEQHLPAWLSPS